MGMADTLWDRAPAGVGRLRVPLLEFDPDLGAALERERYAAAAQRLTVPIEGLEPGPWDREGAAAPPGRLGLLVVDGVLLRSHSIGRVVSAELLGAGDVIRPALGGHEFSLIEAKSRWEVVSSARVAVLDKAFLAAVLHWPEIVIALFERTVYRARFIAFQLALAHVRRIDARLLLLFWRLADRWGRVTSEGVVVPLHLKHAVLGMLVGAQRPSVTTALKHLSEAGKLERRPDGSWLLSGEPPDPSDPSLEPLTGSRSPL
jgi:CRP/FNR family transcriptional regulator, cyclic AMP receptor protein